MDVGEPQDPANCAIGTPNAWASISSVMFFPVARIFRTAS